MILCRTVLICSSPDEMNRIWNVELYGKVQVRFKRADFSTRKKFVTSNGTQNRIETLRPSSGEILANKNSHAQFWVCSQTPERSSHAKLQPRTNRRT